MDPMTQLVAATAAFLLTHFVSSTPLRAALIRGIGEKGYRGLYTLAALATLVWMVYAYNRAPVQPLWPGFKLLPAIFMPFAFILLACGVLSRNPTMVGADKLLKSEEPARGIIRVTRHPVMWGIALWAAAHLLARGDLKSTVFFGGLLVLALAGAAALDARRGLAALRGGDLAPAAGRDRLRAQPPQVEGNRLAQPGDRRRSLRRLLRRARLVVRGAALVRRDGGAPRY
jgi:uncharacterized membrane protein